VPGPATLSAKCPAKLNLFLEVKALRPDGFHEIESVMLPIPSLHDVLSVTTAPPGVMELAIEANPWWKIPPGEQNLVVRAARMLMAECRSDRGVRMRLTKRIPPGSGLGGGSSDAAAALHLVNVLLGEPVPRKRVLEIGAGLGSDVPFFLHGGAAIARGRGEILETARTGPTIRFLVAWPGVQAATPEVYKRCRPPEAGKARAPQDVLAALEKGNAKALGAACFNRLTAPAREVCPATADAQVRLEALGLGPVRVTGSGSACFVVLVPGDSRPVDTARLVQGWPPGAWAGEA
jgi:4-diphosphocytidyl-2-C-methyl-D-erythritol kinase